MTASARQHAGVALFDVDGTLTGVRSIWQYLLEKSGKWLEGERNLLRFLNGETTYEDFCHADAALLEGQSCDCLAQLAARIPLNEGAAEVFQDLRLRGYRIALVSTGLRLMTDVIEARLPVDHAIANDLETLNGVCTGRALVSIDEQAKGDVAARIIERLGGGHTIAVGDGRGDIPMFREVDFSIAVGSADDAVVGEATTHSPGLRLTDLLPIIAREANPRKTGTR